MGGSLSATPKKYIIYIFGVASGFDVAGGERCDC
jgi:hypothetical protein